MKPRIILAAFIIPLGLIIAAVPSSKTFSTAVSPEEILVEVKSGVQNITIDEVAALVIEKDPSVQLAMEELEFFCENVSVLGSYYADRSRYE